MLVNRLLTPSVTPLISWNKSVLFYSSHLQWPELEAVCWLEGRTQHKTRAVLGSVPLLEAQRAPMPALSLSFDKGDQQWQMLLPCQESRNAVVFAIFFPPLERQADAFLTAPVPLCPSCPEGTSPSTSVPPQQGESPQRMGRAAGPVSGPGSC